MIKPIESILFATDLTQNCQQALEFTFVIGSRFKAVTHMLHVIEDLPENVEGQLKGLLGKHQWEDLVQQQQEFVKKSLMGKKTINMVVQEQIQQFYEMADIDDEGIDFRTKEIIISDGEVVESILKNAKDNKCDLIVLGSKETFFSGNSVGVTIRSLLKKSTIPVTVVPAKRIKE